MKPSPPRIPKGSKEGGRPPKWAAEMRNDLADVAGEVVDTRKDIDRHERLIDQLRGFTSVECAGARKELAELSSRLGTSTPLIIWNIAVIVAIAGLGVAVAKLYGVAP